jgi:hypothetical protein
MANNDKSGQRHFLIKVDGIDGFFATKRGGDPSIEVTEEFDGGADEADLIESRPTYEDLVVGRPYAVWRDQPMCARERAKIGKGVRRTVSVTPTSPEGIRAGKATTYHGLLKGVKEPDVDSKSSEGAHVELTFRISRVS